MKKQTNLTDVFIKLAEPSPQFLIVLGVGVKGAGGVFDAADALAVGETFKEGAEFGGRLAKSGIIGHLGSLAGGVLGDVLAVRDVGLKGVEEPGKRGGVVLMLLALDDNLSTTRLERVRLKV